MGTKATLQSKRILVVDDDPYIIQVMTSILEGLDDAYVVDAVYSSSDALTRVRQTGYDLMITDYKMPVMNGFDLAQAVKALSPYIHTILMTAYSSDLLTEEKNTTIIDGYLHKPFSIDQISEMLDRAFSDKPTAYRVLIIEDNAHLSRLYSRALTRSGYETDIAATLAEARVLLDQHRFDILLCDIHIGQERGTDLLHEYAETFHENGTQTIMVSGDASYRAYTEDMGVDFYLEKPVDIVTLTTLVNRLTQRQ